MKKLLLIISIISLGQINASDSNNPFSGDTLACEAHNRTLPVYEQVDCSATCQGEMVNGICVSI